MQAKSYEEYKGLVQTHMSPMVNIAKLLGMKDDGLFITAYRALLPREYQTPAELSRLLMLVDMKQEQRDHRMLKFTSHGEVLYCTKTSHIFSKYLFTLWDTLILYMLLHR